VWLGEADPVKSQEDARAHDPERTALRQRVQAIKKHFHHEDKFTAQNVYSKMMMSDGRNPQYPDLLEAFTNRDGKAFSPKSIGWQLSKDEGRVVDGFSIQIARHSDREGNAYVVMPRPATTDTPAPTNAPAPTDIIPF
jgi:hypothetical protein